MKLQKLKLADIEPYKNNPRKNDDAVNAVAESIRQCSYITPIIVDEDHVIIAGHTRYKALVALGYSQSDSYRAVRSVGNDVNDVESVLKAALSNMSKF